MLVTSPPGPSRKMINSLKRLFEGIPPGTRNGIAILLGEGVSRVLMVLGTLYAARKMGPSIYGQYGMIWAQLQIAWCVVEFGTTMAGTRDIAKALHIGGVENVVSGIYYLRMLLWCLVILGWWVCASWLGVLTYAGANDFTLIAGCLLAMALTPDWMLRGSERFAQMGMAQFSAAIVYLIAVVPLVTFYHSVHSLLVAHVIQTTGACIFQWMIVMKMMKFRFILPSVGLILKYARRGGFFALTGVLYQGAIAGFIWGSGRYFGDKAMGLSTALMRIYQLVNAGSFMLAVGYLPRLARQHSGNKETASLARLMWVSGAVFALVFPFFVVPVAVIFLGTEYSDVKNLAWGASLGLLFGAARYVYSIPLTAQVRHWETVLANSTYCFIAIFTTILLSLWFPFYWISLAITLGEASALIAILLAVKRVEIRYV